MNGEMATGQGSALQKMPAYIGTKVVCAFPMSDTSFRGRKEGVGVPDGYPQKEGYLVIYPDGYESWSPKETFEAAYRLVSDAERRMI
jgi:hypothetical protein